MIRAFQRDACHHRQITLHGVNGEVGRLERAYLSSFLVTKRLNDLRSIGPNRAWP